tara:strand:- start:301 stop:567 length:267 start_codon:yes stop_codon:yes gene_type:complete
MRRSDLNQPNKVKINKGQRIMNIELGYYELLEAIGDYVNKNYPCNFNLDEQIDHGSPISVNIGSQYFDFKELDVIQFSLVTNDEAKGK